MSSRWKVEESFLATVNLAMIILKGTRDQWLLLAPAKSKWRANHLSMQKNRGPSYCSQTTRNRMKCVFVVVGKQSTTAIVVPVALTVFETTWTAAEVEFQV
jgi:hypothetical protein